jgi:hypothetical protein
MATQRILEENFDRLETKLTANEEAVKSNTQDIAAIRKQQEHEANRLEKLQLENATRLDNIETSHTEHQILSLEIITTLLYKYDPQDCKRLEAFAAKLQATPAAPLQCRRNRRRAQTSKYA